jgi:hypothetical protein
VTQLFVAVQTSVLFELASWVAEWSPRGLLVARAYATTAADWHTHAQQALASLPPDQPRREDSRKTLTGSSIAACLLVVHSFAFAGSRSVPRGSNDALPFGATDAQLVLKHLVLAQHLQAICSEEWQSKHELLWNRSLSIARHLFPQIAGHVAHTPDILTVAAAAVYKGLPLAKLSRGEAITWEPLSHEGLSESYSTRLQTPLGRDAVIEINVLLGKVLWNGSMPSLLPEYIVQHPVYRQTFGTLQLLVNDSLTTTEQLDGRTYEFRLASEISVGMPERKGLTVYEHEQLPDGSISTLELLPGVLCFLP